MDKIKKEEYKSAAVMFTLATVLLYAGLYMPLVFIAAPFVMAYTVARSGVALGGGAVVLSFLALAYFDLNTSVVLAAAFLPAALAAGYMIRAKKRFRDSVIAAAGALFAGVALVIAWVWFIHGRNIIDYIVDYAGNSMNALGNDGINSLYQVVRYPDVLTGAITQQAVLATPAAQAVATMQGTLRDTLNVFFVTLLGLYSLLGGLLCCVIPRAIVKSKIKVAPAPAFGDYELPKRFWLAFIATYIFAIIGESLGWRSFDIVGVTVYNLYAFVLSVQALCFLDFMYKRRNMSAGARTLLHVLAAVVLSMFLMWIGILENAIGLRKRMDERQV